MIDFTDCKELLNVYSGSEVKKRLMYDNKNYLVKFPDPVREKNKNISYINNALLRILPNIDTDNINSFIDNIDCMSKIRRDFYKKIIGFRYNILKKVYKRLKGD